MKKVLLVLLAVLLLSGCGNKNKAKDKVLTCNGVVSGLDTTITVKYSAKKNALSFAEVVYVMSLKDYTDYQIEAIKSNDMCANFKDYDFGDCSQKVVKKELIVTASFDLDKLNKEDYGDNSLKLEEIKDKYEDQINGTCVIK